MTKAKAGSGTVVIHVDVDPFIDAPSSESWWDVPVAEVAELRSTTDARAAYEKNKTQQRHYL